MNINNIVEMCNNIFKNSRSKNVLNLFVNIWNRIMIKRFERFCTTIATFNAKTKYIFHVNTLLDKSKLHAKSFHVLFSIDQRDKIQTTTNFLYDVWINVQNRFIYCNCFKFQIFEISCDHVIVFFRHQNQSFQKYLSWNYFIIVWQTQHQTFVSVVRANKFQFDFEHLCDFFFTKTFRDRSRKQRFQTETRKKQTFLMSTSLKMNFEIQKLTAQQRKKRSKHCNICDDIDHDNKTCKQFHN